MPEKNYVNVCYNFRFPPPRLVRAKPSLDLHHLSLDPSNDETLASVMSIADCLTQSNSTTETSGHVSEGETDYTKHELSETKESVVNALDQNELADSGFYPFYPNSAQSFEAMSSTRIEPDEMWPEYCHPTNSPIQPYSPLQWCAVDMSRVSGTNMENGQFLIQNNIQVFPSWMPGQSWNNHYNSACNSNFTTDITGTVDDTQLITNTLQHGVNESRYVEVEAETEAMKSGNCSYDSEPKNKINELKMSSQSNEEVKKVSYLFVDQIDRNQKELLIRASCYMLKFFNEIECEEEESFFRRVLFRGVTRVQFLMLIRYLEHGKEILKKITKETLLTFEQIAVEHGFRSLEIDCHEVLSSNIA